MADCLLNCLREVRLERFHRNFAERGLVNCEQLSSLIVDDYSRFGVVSTDDRCRLYQLIHIIKSVQADGIHCQHGTMTSDTSQLHKVEQPTMIPNTQFPDAGRRKDELPDVTRNGSVPAPNLFAAGDSGTVECPQAPGRPIRPFIKPISTDYNYRVQYEQPADNVRLNATQEMKVVTKCVADDSCGTPKFDCRKTLNFSYSDLYSNDEESSVCNSISLQTCGSGSVVSSSAALTRPSRLRPPQVVATTCVSSPRAFVIPTDKKPVTRHRKSGRHTESQTSVNDQRKYHDREFYQVPSNGHARKKLSFQNDDRQRHAYFPATKIPSPEEQPTLFRRIYHGNSYNYGVPGASVNLSDKVNQLFVWNIFYSCCFVSK